MKQTYCLYIRFLFREGGLNVTTNAKVFFSTHNKCWYITFKEHIEEEEEGRKPCESQNVKTSSAN